ncbi:MAG TPA: putative Ig domain-containing protein, partial [Opitutaceae bacterium]|nr:putative Ig domain-containing protein [Opitutaceae bacterium]
RVTGGGCAAAPGWTSLHLAGSNQIPAAPVRAIAVHPSNPAWLYAGTEIGVFTSENNGATWTTTNDGPGTVSVEELFWLDSTTLVAATHGRGMFRADVLPGGGPVITSAPPTAGTLGVAYTHTYTANGTPAPTFSVTSGALPTGLTLDGVSGLLSGTPSAAGPFTGVVSATNTSGSANQAFDLTIASNLPGAPTIGTATAGNGQASIAFFPPSANGSPPVTSYTVTCNPGPKSATGPSSPIVVAALTNATLYSCSVAATNSAGTGPSSATVNVTPSSSVPIITSAAPGPGTVAVSYSHTYTASGSPAPTFSVTSGALPAGLSLNATSGAVTGTPSTSGTFTGVVSATNAAGTTTQSFSIAIAASVPGAPTIGSATPGVGQASIAFTAPASNGGAAITTYKATCNPGAISGTAAASPITVAGLTGGTAYTCSVTAANSVGTGASSGNVGVTPYAVPVFTSAAPVGGTFGSVYSHTYTASGTPAPTFSVTSGALPGGLSLNAASGVLSGTPTAAGTFNGVVTATNAGGTATQSFSIVIAATVPGAPTIGAATPGNSQASIAFSAPASNGGATITGYTATCTPGPFSGTGAASPVTVTGLSNGTLYSCTVKATNSAGQSAASGSVNVTPGTAPAITSAAPPGGTFNVGYAHGYVATGTPAPTFSVTSGALPTGLTLNATSGAVSGTPTASGSFSGVVTATNPLGTATQSFSIVIASTVSTAPIIGSGTAGNGQATIAFTPPASNGGSAITSYAATCTPGLFSANGAASPITVSGLTNGVTYSCSVTATNSMGTSAASGTVSVTPVAAPVFTSAPPAGGTFNVAYSHTFAANGSPVPTFSVTSGTLPGGLSLNGASGALTGTPTATGTFTGVVTASNSAGTATQAFSIAIAASVPGAPAIGTATPGNSQATITFTPPGANGGAAITAYTATCNPGALTGSSAASPVVVSALTNGVSYTCSVQANNSAGASAASGTVTVTPGVAPSITSATPPAGSFNAAYSHTYAATGSPVPTFSVTSGALPTGLTLNGATGALTGTPTATGTFTGVVSATNTAGAATQGFSIVISATVPGAPTIGTGTPGNGQAAIAFTAPASNGGSLITGYTATCTPGPVSATGSTSPVTVTGLTNGVAYSCSVRANNSIGSSAPSSTVGVTPGIAPVITSAAPVGGTFGVAYSHTYVASASPAASFAVSAGALPAGLSLNTGTGAVTGTPTVAGTFTGSVTATNTAGTSTQNFSIVIAAVAPGAPTIGTATPGNGQASITFTPPASNGGSPITGYSGTCNPGAISTNSAGSPILFAGLTNNVSYTCSVRATNAAGTGSASGTLSVTPTSGVPLTFVGAFSRKNHGIPGVFDLAIDTSQPIGGAVTVESRAIGAGHKIAFVFSDGIGSAGTATCVDASATPVGSVSTAIVGNAVE